MDHFDYVCCPLPLLCHSSVLHVRWWTNRDLLMVRLSFFSSCLMWLMAVLYLAAVSLCSSSLLVRLCSASITCSTVQNVNYVCLTSCFLNTRVFRSFLNTTSKCATNVMTCILTNLWLVLYFICRQETVEHMTQMTQMTQTPHGCCWAHQKRCIGG